MRKSYDEIEKIANKLSCTDIFSWSKINCYKTDTYEYYLKYIQRLAEDRNDSIYKFMGGSTHEILEDFYDNKLDHNGMLEKFEEKIFEYDVAGFKYDRSDEDKNKKIALKYESCLKHFFKNHQKIPFKMKKEMFIPIKINNILIQGYIDFIHQEKRNNKNIIVVTDWKTSSIYKGDKIDTEKGQLLLYGLGIHQKLKIPLNQIIVRWNFMKYVNINCLQVNGKWKTRTIERCNIGNKLASSVKMWLKKSSEDFTEEKIDNYIVDLIATNSIDKLPNDVKDKFIINDCYVEVELTKKSIDELKKDIINTVSEIKDKELKYKNTKDDKIWWQDVNDKDSYRLANLSGYSAKLHKPYKEYLNNLNMFNNENDNDNSNDKEEDLKWLKDILD